VGVVNLALRYLEEAKNNLDASPFNLYYRLYRIYTFSFSFFVPLFLTWY
jgi:hypothetical protein